jgi:hypothetical protein
LPPHDDDDDQVCHLLANFMEQSVRRWLGEGEDEHPYVRKIQRATHTQELLPHLHPLIDAIVAKAGTDAGAEFADMAAFILNPAGHETTPATMV